MPRSEARNQRMRDERREQILSTALRLFATRGLAATRVSDIATGSRIAQGLLYHYFAAKEDIFVELVRRAFERLNAAARALEALPLPPREKLGRALAALLQSTERSEDFARTVLLLAQATASEAIPPKARAIIRRDNRLAYEVIARILRAGQADGSVRDGDPDELALVFWTMIKGLAIHRAAHGASFRAPAPALLARVFLEEMRS